MNLQVQRQAAWSSPKSSMGSLSLNGVFYAYTLEPPMRVGDAPKPYAIPAGSYPIKLEESPHFTALMAANATMAALFGDLFPDGKVITPHLYNVPDFELVEIHPGNLPEDTEGCTLVGSTRGTDYVSASDMAFRVMMKRLLSLPASESIVGEYSDPL